jgi:hypothetical protein
MGNVKSKGEGGGEGGGEALATENLQWKVSKMSSLMCVSDKMYIYIHFRKDIYIYIHIIRICTYVSLLLT